MGEVVKIWLVCAMDGLPLSNSEGNVIEHRSAASALKAATKHISESEDEEAWVYALSHVVSRPQFQPVIDQVR